MSLEKKRINRLFGLHRTRLMILPVKSGIAVGIADVQGFSSGCNITSNAFIHGKANTGAFIGGESFLSLVIRVVDQVGRFGFFSSDIEDSRVQFFRSRIDEKQRGPISID